MHRMTHRAWLWWGERWWTIAGREIALPDWPWRMYCTVRGHSPIDECGRPEHRYCWVCRKATPHATV